ncbi:hypothetical protein BJ508DRAFT_326172 [Ascobolus immersus RN42]|uniref:Uncharacterized protein n=1 Tax=Ascobolus immersus RN42 TaxID=1160509 RepID=A0A3N4I6K2_ASCIM|nr:hypothetical protein BJ508DRAFT_326172 [Ascobolus immersus RN42]
MFWEGTGRLDESGRDDKWRYTGIESLAQLLPKTTTVTAPPPTNTPHEIHNLSSAHLTDHLIDTSYPPILISTTTSGTQLGSHIMPKSSDRIPFTTKMPRYRPSSATIMSRVGKIGFVFRPNSFFGCNQAPVRWHSVRFELRPTEDNVSLFDPATDDERDGSNPPSKVFGEARPVKSEDFGCFMDRIRGGAASNAEGMDKEPRCPGEMGVAVICARNGYFIGWVSAVDRHIIMDKLEAGHHVTGVFIKVRQFLCRGAGGLARGGLLRFTDAAYVNRGDIQEDEPVALDPFTQLSIEIERHCQARIQHDGKCAVIASHPADIGECLMLFKEVVGGRNAITVRRYDWENDHYDLLGIVSVCEPQMDCLLGLLPSHLVRAEVKDMVALDDYSFCLVLEWEASRRCMMQL